MNAIDRYFGISASGSTYRRETVGGLTIFATMSYIIFVQPAVLSAAGMSSGYVMVATCLSAAFATALMGIVARYPFALAPGMGENFLFALAVCAPAATGGMGFSWRAGLAIVFVSGALFVVLSLFQFRTLILNVFPDCLKNAIGPAIGLFIAFVGLQWGGVVVANPGTMVGLGALHKPETLLTMFGVVLMASLLAWNVRGGILAGILATAALGWITGVVPFHAAPLNWDESTFFSFNFSELVQKWDTALIAILLFFFLDLFDTVGTLVGVGKQAGFIGDDGKLERAGHAFFCDAAGTCLGAVVGTSTVTSYIESASGVAAGARTGFASVVTALCFLVALGIAPFLSIPQTTVAPALIVVGFLMMAPLRRVKWEDVTESFPAFMTLSMMVFGYGITEGIAMGCMSFAVIKTSAGRWREVHPVMYGVAIAFATRYMFLR